MIVDELTSGVRRFGVAGAALLMGLLPVAFPNWISTLAEAYSAEGYGAEGYGATPSSTATPAEALAAAAAATGNVGSVSMSGAIYDACVSGANAGTNFQRDCQALLRESQTNGGNATEMLVQLTVDQGTAMSQIATQQVDAGRNLASARMAGSRLASGLDAYRPGDALASMLLYGPGTKGGGAGADAQIGRLSAYFNFKYLNSSRDANQYTFGYDMDGWTFMLGADARVTDHLTLGAMLHYAQSDADAKRTNSTLKSDDWGFAGYGTWFQDNGLFLEAIAGYISHDYDSQRRINYTTNAGGVTTVVNQIASASPSGDTLFGGIGGGYSIARDAFTFTPQASLNYSRQSIDGYREAMSNPTGPGGSWAVAVDGQDFTSMTSRLGFMLANAISTGVGVFVPQLSVDWVHEFDDGLERVNSRFVNDRSGQRFQVYSDHSDKNWFDVGLGLSAQFAQGRSAFVSVNWLAGRADEDTYSITGGIRLEF